MGDRAFDAGARPGPGRALMPPVPTEPDAEERLRAEAAEWFARMRAPESGEDGAAFEAWLGLSGHREVYDRMAVRWRQSDLISRTRVGQEREGLPAAPARRHRGGYYALAASLVAAIAIGLTCWALSGERPDGAGVQSGMAGTAITSPVGIRQV